jgi:predicted NBD/HSP70 family sugar kinase
VKRNQGASSEVARDINRRLVLNLVRTRHPISRADLARVSGLQRSTVSLIIEQLIDEHWVVEGATGRLPRGRRPTFLRLNDERVIIAVDLRPIETTVALADANGKFISQEVINTAPDSKLAIGALIQSIQRIRLASRRKKIEGIGISVPGRYHHVLDRLAFAPNLKWPNVDLRSPIAKATGLEVAIENAANACVLAAVWFDHMEECRSLVVVTVSEGIGTGIWANGQLIRGLNGMAGEFGHVPLNPDGPLCSCGSHGCWEIYGSNSAALRYYREAGAPSDNLNFRELLSRAGAGDSRAASALESMARYLGRGMRMLAAGLAPERIIIVGDLTRSWHRFGPVIESELQQQVLPGASMPLLAPAYEDGMARLRGTVALVLQKDFGLLRDLPG